MNTTRHAGSDNQDGAGERAPETRAVGSRRPLLGMMAGGLALAASGLLVPSHGRLVLGHEGVLDGELGGRRDNDQRGRDRQKRRRRDRRNDNRNDNNGNNDNDGNPGNEGPRRRPDMNCMLQVRNGLQSGPPAFNLSVEIWVQTWEDYERRVDIRLIDQRTVSPGSELSVRVPVERDLSIVLNTRYLVSFGTRDFFATYETWDHLVKARISSNLIPGIPPAFPQGDIHKTADLRQNQSIDWSDSTQGAIAVFREPDVAELPNLRILSLLPRLNV